MPSLQNQKLTTIVAVLSVTWHALVGCCGHHAHDQLACQRTTVASSISNSQIVATTCQHCHVQSGGFNSSPSNLTLDSEAPKNYPDQGTCDQGKCSFWLGYPPVQAPSSDVVSLDCLTLIALSTCSTNCKLSDGLRICRSIGPSGANAARTQQLLCVWLL
jgi:hypothetical protein